MRHLIMGTAGHVDHGKTTLVKALTGIDCDTHPEEKRRGITINLGFAHLPLPSGDTIGIIDVPGHKDFVHTMVSGASGIDFACLVVAADAGIMPQTREHIQIMEMLGIRKGIVAVTRIDCADRDLTAMACEEIREFTGGTFLRGCPVCPVSARTGQGIEELKKAIYNIAAAIEERPVGSLFRMFIDRVFTVKGFGAVATGSVLSGVLRREQKAYMLPGGKEVRVRGLERHGAPVELVTAGDRASVNLAGFEKSEFRPGMMIAGGLFTPTELIDVQLRLFRDARPLGLWSEAMFICGTYEAQTRIHLIDADMLDADQHALAQIALPRPLPALYGDRFILRDTSGDRTLGGGLVIDAAPSFHRRRPASLISDIRNRADDGLAGAIAAEIRKRNAPVQADDIEALFNISGKELRTALRDGAAMDDILYDERDKTRVLLSKQTADALAKEIRRLLAAHHDRNPLSEEGCGVESLCAMLRLDQRLRPYIAARLDEMESAGSLKKVNGTYALPDRRGQMTPLLRKQMDFVEECFRLYGERTPSMAEIRAKSTGQGIDASLFQWITNRLTEQKKLCPTGHTYLHAAIVNAYRPRLFSMLRDRPEGITVIQFRDAVSAGRDFCVLLCDYFDREGVTLRKGNVRVLTEKGREEAASMVTLDSLQRARLWEARST